MKRNFESLWGELLNELPALPPTIAQRYVSESWLEIQSEREWSWRNKDGLLIIPASITTGTILLTQNSRNATLDSTALAAWNAIGLTPPFVTNRQLRFPLRPERIYNIESFDSGTGAIVLDKLYTPATAAASTYTLYSAYHILLDATGTADPYFERLVTARSLDYGWAFMDARHLTTRELLDRRDPGRTMYGLPRFYTYQADKETTLPSGETGTLRQIELWPHSTGAISFETRYIQRPISFDELDTQLLPEIIEPRYVILNALAKVYRWAEANKSSLPGTAQRTNWQYLRAQLTSEYPTDRDTIAGYRRKCFSRDDEILQQTLLTPLPDYMDNLLAPSPTLVITSS